MVALVLGLLLTLVACTGDGEGRPRAGAAPEGPVLEGCGPVTFDRVRGDAPSHVPARLDRFPNDHALCGGRWVHRVNAGLVPQGLVVRGGEAWVSGWEKEPHDTGHRCRVVRMDLRTGEVLRTRAGLRGSVGGRPEVHCHHAGGLALDEHGLWIIETRHLWLVDPETLEVRRTWSVQAPSRGSFGTIDDAGRLAMGRFRRGGPARLDWFAVEDLLAPGLLDVTEDLAVAHQPVPPWGQGAIWADLGPGPEGLWVTSAHTLCAVLVGPRGTRRGFLPGAEGIALGPEGALWAVTEATARRYVAKGGRLVVPTLARFAPGDVTGWTRPTCRP